jgi:hypothetical protein
VVGLVSLSTSSTVTTLPATVLPPSGAEVDAELLEDFRGAVLIVLIQLAKAGGRRGVC